MTEPGTPPVEVVAISPAIGPLPAVYVPQKPAGSAADALWHAAARTTRQLRRRANRRNDVRRDGVQT